MVFFVSNLVCFPLGFLCFVCLFIFSWCLVDFLKVITALALCLWACLASWRFRAASSWSSSPWKPTWNPLTLDAGTQVASVSSAFSLVFSAFGLEFSLSTWLSMFYMILCSLLWAGLKRLRQTFEDLDVYQNNRYSITLEVWWWGGEMEVYVHCSHCHFLKPCFMLD